MPARAHIRVDLRLYADNRRECIFLDYKVTLRPILITSDISPHLNRLSHIYLQCRTIVSIFATDAAQDSTLFSGCRTVAIACRLCIEVSEDDF